MISKLIAIFFFAITIVQGFEYKCTPADRKSLVCPMDCALGMFGVDLKGVKVESCCNTCMCCANSQISVVKVIDIEIEPQDFMQQLKVVKVCAEQDREQRFCPEYFMLGIVGVDAKGNVVNKNCGNPCFCCGDKNIVKVELDPTQQFNISNQTIENQVMLPHYECTEEDRLPNKICPEYCIAQISSILNDGTINDGCCNPCLCCQNSNVTRVIHPPVQPIFNCSAYDKVSEFAPCPTFCIESVAGLREDSSFVSGCCNECLCCQDQTIKQVYLQPTIAKPGVAE